VSKLAVVLLSGGLDSVTCLALAQKQGYGILALSFSYGQRHNSELISAQKIAKKYKVIEHQIIDLDLGRLGGSALTDTSIDIPTTASELKEIPITYVPARNTLFLSYALAFSEVHHARDIFIGVNAVDYSGYPDCRPEYIESFQAMANLATKQSIEGEGFTIHTPLINLSKAEIITQGTELGVDYSETVSCYQADENGLACGKCDSCYLRQEGFKQAKLKDPTKYIS
jgi:7-cyano-7-deazaguanine synthase